MVPAKGWLNRQSVTLRRVSENVPPNLLGPKKTGEKLLFRDDFAASFIVFVLPTNMASTYYFADKY